MASRLLFVATIVQIGATQITNSIGSDQASKLSRENLLNLDKEVSRFYETNYDTLDRQNATYDEHLFELLRAIRHTIVIHLFDYKYTDDSIMERSMGSKVDAGLCKRQLIILTKMAKMRRESSQAIPLSVMNFIESTARVEPGILNGNCVWFGSHASCAHAKIPAKTVGRFLDNHEELQDITGRLCMAHLRAKTWPKWDVHFGDRISIRMGVCLPESCHSKIHKQDKQVQDLVDYLARHDLVPPYNDDTRYEISELYCFPDEDSPHRKLDLGTKLFVAFVLIWIGITVYANLKFRQRRNAMRQLREIVDIKMVFCETGGFDEPASKTINSLDEMQQNSPEMAKSKREYANTNLAKQCGQSLNSDDASQSSGAKTNKEDNNDRLDFVQAFSIESNFEYLFKSRPNLHKTSNPAQRQMRQREQHQMSKDISKYEAYRKKTKSNDSTTNRSHHKSSRVDLNVLDGLKIFGTIYIVTGHTFMFLFGILPDLRFSVERMLDTELILVINGLQVVGLFYIIAGILTTFLVFSREKRKVMQPSFWILVIIGRYCRLIPTYLLVFWFARHVAPYTGAGETWIDYRTDREHARGHCANESWFTMLTLSSADIKVPLGCLPQSWYLSNDFRTLLVLPIYIIVLAINYKAGYAAIFATISYSTLKLIRLLANADIDYKVMLKWHPHVYSLMADRLHDIYTDHGIRMSTYMLSVLTGHILYLYETRQIKDWPNWFRNWALKASILVASVFFFGAPILASPMVSKFLPNLDDIDSNLIILLIPLFKVTIESVICIVLLSLMTGGGYRWVREALSSRTFKILANISYAVFLVHVEIIYKYPVYKITSTFWHLFAYSTFFIAFSYMAATVIYIFYEMPINNILRIIFKRAIKHIS